MTTQREDDLRPGEGIVLSSDAAPSAPDGTAVADGGAVERESEEATMESPSTADVAALAGEGEPGRDEPPLTAGPLAGDSGAAEAVTLPAQPQPPASQPPEGSTQPSSEQMSAVNGAQAASVADAVTDQQQTQLDVASTTSEQAVHEENERLRKELEALRASVKRHETPGRVRRALVGVLVFLCCIGILSSTLTVWASSTFLNTDNWLQIVGPIGSNSQVIQAVSAYTADQVVTLLNVQQRAEQALPPKASFLAVPLTKVVHDFTQGRIANLMHRPAFQQVWISTNRYVHDELLAALRGQSTTVHITNGVVTLNLIPIIDQGLQLIQQNLPGLIADRVKLPNPSELQVPEQAQQKLSQALGIQVPANLGQIELFQSAQLAKAQQLLRLWDFLTVALPVITAGLIIVTLWLSRDRRRTLIELGIAVAISFIAVKIAANYLQSAVVNAIATPTARDVAQSTLQTVLTGLATITTWLLVGGVAVAVAAYLAGKPQWFRAAYAQSRAGYARVEREIQARRHRAPPNAGVVGTA